MIDNIFILERLTEGLLLEMKRLVVTYAPKTTEWRELMFKLPKTQPTGKNIENKKTTGTISPSIYV